MHHVRIGILLGLAAWLPATAALSDEEPKGDLAAPTAETRATPNHDATPLERIIVSKPRRTAGIALTFIGVALGVVGTGVLVGMTVKGDFLWGSVIGGSLMGIGVGHAAVGVPLWVSGAREVSPPTGFAAERRGRAASVAQHAAAIPQVSISATSGSLTWSF